MLSYATPGEPWWAGSRDELNETATIAAGGWQRG
jgi:hypothetical protein